MGVSALEVISESIFQKYTCATEDDAYEKDLGKMLFWTLMFTRLALIPAMSRCCYKENVANKQKFEKLQLFESMAVDASKAMFFIVLTARIYSIGAKVYWPVAMLSLWPVFLFIYSQRDKQFEQGAYQQYLAHFDKKHWAYGFTAGELVFSAFSMAGSCGVVSSLCFDIFYSSSHNNDWKYQNDAIAGLITLGFVFGAITQFSKKYYHFNHVSNEFIDVYYFSFMNMASTLACVKPETMVTPEGFNEHGWKYCLAFAAASLVIAAGVILVSSNKHTKEKDLGRQRLFSGEGDPLIAGKDSGAVTSHGGNQNVKQT